MDSNLSRFSQIAIDSERPFYAASGWAQAAGRALGYVQPEVRQGKYQGMSPPAAQRGPGPREPESQAHAPPPHRDPSIRSSG